MSKPKPNLQYVGDYHMMPQYRGIGTAMREPVSEDVPAMLMERVSALEELTGSLTRGMDVLVGMLGDTNGHVLELAKAGWELSAEVTKVRSDLTTTDTVLRTTLQALPDPATPNSVYSFPDDLAEVSPETAGPEELLYVVLPDFPDVNDPASGAYFNNHLFDIITEALVIGIFDNADADMVWKMVLGTVSTCRATEVVSCEIFEDTAALVAQWAEGGKRRTASHLNIHHRAFLVGMIAATIDAVSAAQVAKFIDKLFSDVFTPDDPYVQMGYINVTDRPAMDSINASVKKVMADNAAMWRDGNYAL